MFSIISLVMLIKALGPDLLIWILAVNLEIYVTFFHGQTWPPNGIIINKGSISIKFEFIKFMLSRLIIFFTTMSIATYCLINSVMPYLTTISI